MTGISGRRFKGGSCGHILGWVGLKVSYSVREEDLLLSQGGRQTDFVEEDLPLSQGGWQPDFVNVKMPSPQNKVLYNKQ